ncbi:hypothetical protein PanWU01x14_004460 [Parasponia andersonii]|uniref:Uncharacterized protein n=1 Tax=Parasponia andersonii TaxID=3476 RepID=A0A2P5E369_PARAD|nr:hypothetical protein PanWU01x14_004460 [Parasponia andersonii]
MSGMIPGVGVPHRRRINHHNQQAHTPHNHPLYLPHNFDPSMDLDETALRARQRLEKRLLRHCLHLPSSRSNSSRPSGGEDRNPKAETKDDDGLDSKLGSFRMPWSFHSHRRKFQRSESDIKVTSCC